ncbi:hypothetical protein [Salinibacterium sp. SWN1162]|uniref:hypothetical protein n=1 Tax=Salinibacterium sp. SWN1162 TaxID=2792053 RepID=UPI0018CD5EDF|nr:hypothetical protein [Salinibacterium sp. SWN1162]MBH0009569.1 hypothetical protein [Salinibacterium sp. SWN1162]
MESIRINLAVSQRTESGGRELVPLCVAGQPDSNYNEAIERAAHEAGVDIRHDLALPFIDFEDPEFGVTFTILIDDSATLEGVLEIVGDEAHADPPTLQAGRGGRGGGGEFVPLLPEYLISSIRLSAEIWGYGVLALGVWQLGVKRYFANIHRLAADWVRTEQLDDELRQKVLSRSEWTETELNKVFGLSLESTSLLLTTLGYEFHRRDGEGIWVDVRSEEIHNRKPWQ